MSCNIVEDEVTNVIVQGFNDLQGNCYLSSDSYVSCGGGHYAGAELDMIGQALLNTNYESVNNRYDEHDTPPVYYHQHVILWRDMSKSWRNYNFKLLYKAIKNWEYQSSEADSVNAKLVKVSVSWLKDRLTEKIICALNDDGKDFLHTGE